jgi:hypothetical protein
MDETRRLDLRPFVAVLAVAFVAATIWAAVALAAGGSSSPSSSNTGNDSPWQFVQAQDESQAPRGEDCPDQGGGSGGSGDDAGPDGSGSSDL